MNILDKIKAECEKCRSCDTDKCCFWDDYKGECIIQNRPDFWDIEEIEKRLSCDQLATNLRLKCNLDCSNCTDKQKCDRRNDGQTET